ncbi:MAG: SDR family NAD(P)-dependent oxidoreductase [Actinobacteria bacterium]|nr:SDR family NAD(P)-dependent oxidoreductase [Actinomycetota bacterium]
MQITEGKVAVVTGAGSGIGLGMARAFAGAGMRLVLADIESGALDAAVAELRVAGHEAIGVRTDVSRLSEVEALASATMDTYGAVHVLCNNAGVGVAAPIGQTSIEDWEWTLAIDLWGPIYGVKTFLPLIEAQGEGHLNSTASMAGLLAGPTLGAYNVAKHGVVALMASLERDLRVSRSPIRASVLCPGPINTKITSSERNRPADSAAGHVQTAQGDKFWGNLSALLSQGMDPDEVGTMVLDAILQERFWVLTHPKMARLVQAQVDAMVGDQSLVRV